MSRFRFGAQELELSTIEDFGFCNVLGELWTGEAVVYSSSSDARAPLGMVFSLYYLLQNSRMATSTAWV